MHSLNCLDHANTITKSVSNLSLSGSRFLVITVIEAVNLTAKCHLLLVSLKKDLRSKRSDTCMQKLRVENVSIEITRKAVRLLF